MPVEGVDYAWDHPSSAGLVAAGKVFACRYLSFDGSKNLTRDELADLAAHGIAVVSNWEHTANGARGKAAGHAHATEALELARALGMPEDRPIYFSVDWDATPDELAGPVRDYFAGVGSVIGVERAGVYGGYNTVTAAVKGRWARWYWQTYAWSGGRWHPRAHIRQYDNGVHLAGAELDLDRAMTDDYGQWGVDDVGLTAPERKYLQVTSDRLGALALLRPKTGTGEPLPLVAAVLEMRANIKALAGKDWVNEAAIVSGVLAGLAGVPAADAAAALKAVLSVEQVAALVAALTV